MKTIIRTIATRAVGMYFLLGVFGSANGATISFTDTAANDSVSVSTDLMGQLTSTCGLIPECLSVVGTAPAGTLVAVTNARAFMTEPGTSTVSDQLTLNIVIVAALATIGVQFQSDLEGTSLGPLPAGFTGVPETGDTPTILNGTDAAGRVINRFQVMDPVTGVVTVVALPGSFVVTATSDLEAPPPPVSEPSILVVLGSGLAGLAGMAWRRHRQ